MRNFIYISFLFLFCLANTSAKAQPTLDTIMTCLKQKPHRFAKFDTRNSFINNSRAKIFGIKAGLNYGDRVRFAIGYNQLYPPAKNFDKQIYFGNSNNELDSVTAKLRLFYISASAEYVFYQTKHWQLSMPLQFGLGQTYYKYDLFGKKKEIEKDVYFVYEPAVSIEYKFVKWAGVGADIGYRFMLSNYNQLNKKFTSPTYAFKFLLYYNEIIKSVFPKSKLAKRM